MEELTRAAAIEQEYADVLQALSDPELVRDRTAFREASQRHKQLEEVVRAIRALRAANEDLTAAHEMLDEAPQHERELAREELAGYEHRVEILEAELRDLLLPRDPNDGRNVIISIRGAEGGEEANLFAKNLYEMYQRYADRCGWRIEVLSFQASDLGGIDEATFVVSGKEAWQRLKFEGGVHRVQRVPATESQGRVHTSSAAVTVLPEADEVEVELNPADLRIDVYRSTGPGGQSVNTTDSAVRITHVPTGVVVAMQDEKSQIQNRAKAMTVLRARLLKLEQDRQADELSKAKREQVGTGGRSEKIRTYNYKQNRVTDHRLERDFSLDRILAGELEDLVEALGANERSRQLAEGH